MRRLEEESRRAVRAVERFKHVNPAGFAAAQVEVGALAPTTALAASLVAPSAGDSDGAAALGSVPATPGPASSASSAASHRSR